jgi:integrase
MGKLYKRGATWYADYLDRQGRRRQVSTRTADRKVALARLRDLELSTTDSGPHETEALSDALDYFTEVTCAAKPEGTRSSYGQKARHLGRLLGHHQLDSIKREHVERYVAARLGEGAHRHTIHKELVVLRGTLRAAQARDRYHGSLEVVPRFEADYEPRRTYLTPDQFLRMTEELVARPPANATPETIAKVEERRAQRVLHCMLIAFASPRVGELAAMTWEHVDLRRNLLIVPRGKTVSRIVAIAAALRPWLEVFGERAGWTGPVVQPWGSMRRDLTLACARAGVPRVTANDLRRTFASWLVQQGESLFVVATLLGHSSTRMVEKVYGRLDEATLAAAISRLPGGGSDCNAGVTRDVRTGGTRGAGGNAIAQAAIENSVENPVDSAVLVVPRDGVEPPTRGFSVRCSTS